MSRKIVIKLIHKVERVPKGYKLISDKVNVHHERHTLIHGDVAAYGTSLEDAHRIMNIRVHGLR